MPQFSFRNYTIRFSKSKSKSNSFSCQALWYIKSQTSVVEPCSWYPSPELAFIPQQYYGGLEVLYLSISKRQAKEITEVLDFKKEFCVIQGYVFHHGPSAPDSVVSLFKDRKDLKFVSCIGWTHPMKEYHICATHHALGVKLKEGRRKNKFTLSVYKVNPRNLLPVD